MPPESESARLLLLTTLALEQSLDNGNWEEASALLNRREELLLQLEREVNSAFAETLAQVKAAEARLILGLQGQMRDIASEIQTAKVGRTANRAYSQAAVDGASFGQF